MAHPADDIAPRRVSPRKRRFQLTTEQQDNNNDDKKEADAAADIDSTGKNGCE